jgi:hypothetical protein
VDQRPSCGAEHQAPDAAKPRLAQQVQQLQYMAEVDQTALASEPRKETCDLAVEGEAGLVDRAGCRHRDLRLELEGRPCDGKAVVCVSATQHLNKFSRGAPIGPR